MSAPSGYRKWERRPSGAPTPCIPISDLQIEYSMISRAPEAKIFPTLEELGIVATVYGVVSRGLLTGSRVAGRGDIRNHFPRFAGENLARNQAVVDTLKKLAAAKGASPAQLATAWVLAKGPHIIPVLGPRTRAAEDNLGALRLHASRQGSRGHRSSYRALAGGGDTLRRAPDEASSFPKWAAKLASALAVSAPRR